MLFIFCGSELGLVVLLFIIGVFMLVMDIGNWNLFVLFGVVVLRMCWIILDIVFCVESIGLCVFCLIRYGG